MGSAVFNCKVDPQYLNQEGQNRIEDYLFKSNENHLPNNHFYELTRENSLIHQIETCQTSNIQQNRLMFKRTGNINVETPIKEYDTK